MLVRMIIGKYVIGKGIVPFLRFLIEQLKRLEKFMFMYGTMKLYYHYKDRPYYQMLEEQRRNDTRIQEIYGRKN